MRLGESGRDAFEVERARTIMRIVRRCKMSRLWIDEVCVNCGRAAEWVCCKAAWAAIEPV